jgi:methionine-rich copper-binding protein CopC
MKKVAFITLIAALVLGVNTQNANAANLNEKAAVEANGGQVNAGFNEATQTITLRMNSPEGQERVSVTLTSQSGDVVFQETVLVNQRGTQLQIPLAEFAQGIYFLRVNGNTISYSERYKKK